MCFSFVKEGTTGSRSGAPPSSLPARSWRGLGVCHTLSWVNTVWLKQNKTKPERAWKRLVLFCDGAEQNDESHLTVLDIEEGEGLEEYQDVGEEEEEDDVEEEGIKEEELVSSQDMEHIVIVVAPRRWV